MPQNGNRLIFESSNFYGWNLAEIIVRRQIGSSGHISSESVNGKRAVSRGRSWVVKRFVTGASSSCGSHCSRLAPIAADFMVRRRRTEKAAFSMACLPRYGPPHNTREMMMITQMRIFRPNWLYSDSKYTCKKRKKIKRIWLWIYNISIVLQILVLSPHFCAVSYAVVCTELPRNLWKSPGGGKSTYFYLVLVQNCKTSTGP